MNRYPVTYSHLFRYDAGKPGITVPVVLALSHISVNAETKLDTGSSYCIFERFLGERLGLDIERGHPQWISTVTGSFLTYGHNVTMNVDEFSFDTMVYFAVDHSFKRNVVGRFGLMQQMLFGVDDYAGELYLASSNTIGV